MNLFVTQTSQGKPSCKTCKACKKNVHFLADLARKRTFLLHVLQENSKVSSILARKGH